MLGFILSKMQMLIFATGIVIVGLLFLGFISNIQVKDMARNNIFDVEKIVQERLSSENVCSSNSLTIPDVLYYGVNNSGSFFYDLTFSKVSLTAQNTVGDYNALIISISEHGKSGVLASRMIPMKANIVLVDPGIIIGADMMKLSQHYNKDKIILYPRSARSGAQVAPANSFIVLKEVINGESQLYVVPCSSMLGAAPGSGLTSNCTSNLLMIGCYNLKLAKSNNPSTNDKIPDCFSLAITDNLNAIVRDISWQKCKDLFPGIESA